MPGASAALKSELSGLRTGRASPHLLDPVHGRRLRLADAAQPVRQRHRPGAAAHLGQRVGPLAGARGGKGDRQFQSRLVAGDRRADHARLRIPELNEERRKELVKVAHKYAETARVAVRHVRRDGMDLIKKLEKDHKISKDDHDRYSAEVQKATEQASPRSIICWRKEKEILTV